MVDQNNVTSSINKVAENSGVNSLRAEIERVPSG